MDEALLVDMMSGLIPELIQNNYIEKDMRRGKIPVFGRLFSAKKATIFQYDNIFRKSMNTGNQYGSTDSAEPGDIGESVEAEEYGMQERNISIGIFKKGFPNLIKIISGITAAFVVVGGIIIFVIKHHKIVVKLFHKKAQIIY